MPRLRPEDLEATDEERALARQQSSGTQAAGVGGALGTAAGAALGALLGIPTGGALSAPLAGVGAGVGGALGSAIGGQIGQGQADDATEKLQKLDEERQKKLTEYQLRQQALDDLMGQS
jgi:hypothetical protein